MAPQPLAGLRILDCSRVLAGPYCTMLLGDLGADVIKVENPAGGDDTRQWEPPAAGGEAAYYLAVNRNKRSVVLNLNTEDDREILRQLAKGSDVFVENFRPGTTARWRIDFETLLDVNPRIVYCSILGYGPLGPLADRPGYDFALQAASGLMAITGEPDGQPVKLGVAIVDLLAGLHAANAIQAALLARFRNLSTKGTRIEVSLLESALAALINVGQGVLMTGQDAGRFGNAHPNIVPYQLFTASDGWFALAVGNDRQFRALAELLDHAEWASDSRFKTNTARVRNRVELVSLLTDTFGDRPLAHWIPLLEAAGIPYDQVLTVAQALGSAQARALGIVKEVEHPTAGRIRFVTSPARFDGELPSIRRPPPLLGEHTREILAEVALSASAADA